MSGPHVLAGAELTALADRSSAHRAAVLLAIDYLPALPPAPRTALLEEARAWLADCGWDADADALPDALVVRGVHRHHAGGWPAFVVANVDLLEVRPAS